MSMVLFSTENGDREVELASTRQYLANEIDCYDSKSNPSAGYSLIVQIFDERRTPEYTMHVAWDSAELFDNDVFKGCNIADIIVNRCAIRVISDVEDVELCARQLTREGQGYLNQLTDELLIPEGGIAIDKWFFARDVNAKRFYPGDEQVFLEYLFEFYTEDLEGALRGEEWLNDEQYLEDLEESIHIGTAEI